MCYKDIKDIQTSELIKEMYAISSIRITKSHLRFSFDLVRFIFRDAQASKEPGSIL